MADGPYPAIGLYWYDNVDPTVPPGMQAPLKQLLVRTDQASIYYKSGPLDTDWTAIGEGSSTPGGVVTDNVTIQGDGSIAQPVRVKQIEHDATLTGAGTVASPLGTVAGATPVATDGVTLQGLGTVTSPIRILQVEHDASMTGAGTVASPLAVTFPTPTVHSDGVTITGDGSVGTPIKILAVQTDATLTGAGTVASPLHAVIPASTIHTDGVTLTGDGSVATPAKILAVQTDATLTGAGTVASPLSVAAPSPVLSLINANAGVLVIGTPVYSSSAGHVDKALANALATSTVIGLAGVAPSIGIGASGLIVPSGPLSATTAQWDAVTGDVGGLVFNALYWLDPATAGKLTRVAPSAGGQVAAAVGVAVSTTIMVVRVQPTVLL